MIYPYRCDCGKEFKAYKHHKNIDDIEVCPDCGHNCTKANRYIGRTHFYGAEVEDAEYNPALGCVTRNKKHRDAIAKQKGLIEVGNEDMNKYNKSLDQEQEKKRRDRWEKL